MTNSSLKRAFVSLVAPETWIVFEGEIAISVLLNDESTHMVCNYERMY